MTRAVSSWAGRSPGRSVFDLTVSAPPPAPSEGPAPPFRKQKKCAAGAKFWSNHCETGGFSCILATQATAQPPPYPIWTDPTDPARRPSDRPIGPLGPYSWAPLGLGLTALRARAPPGPPVFSVFVFSRPPAAPGPLGRALTVRSKTLRPVCGCHDLQEPFFHMDHIIRHDLWDTS